MCANLNDRGGEAKMFVCHSLKLVSVEMFFKSGGINSIKQKVIVDVKIYIFLKF